MRRVGIGGMIMMEVALSVPPGPVEFFSAEWRALFAHAVTEAGRLGLQVSMNSAPGWTGSGGPWVTPEQSMQKVVASETTVTGPVTFDAVLPQPETVQGFYRDIVVLAFPAPEGAYRIADIDEKALYVRGPISSQPGVRPAFVSQADYEEPPSSHVIVRDRIVDVTANMDESGRLTWDVPPGSWIILRFGHTSTGQTNRPAPLPGLECDKLDTEALDAHFEAFTATLLDDAGPARDALVAVHLDSWEVGAQNWTRRFREEFRARRGYDILPYLPVMTGRVVESVAISERFLWDLRQTVSELIVENHGRHLRGLAAQHGLWFSIEPYDMTPCDDMTLGATADVPMCEFWSKGFDTRYSVKEATSVAHVYGKPLVAAEAFTSVDRWLFHPGTIKAQGDWAFCEGVNRLVIHRYIHQPFPQARPGLSLGPHGLHYERTQTWWEYSRPWHEYLARCQHVLRQGRFVADVLYLSPEGAPNVFQSPEPAPLGYKFDACTPEALLTRATVSEEGEVVFLGSHPPNPPSKGGSFSPFEGGGGDVADGMRYRLLVLPRSETMTPALLAKVAELAEAGVAIIGAPPIASPSLSGYPQCDEQVQEMAEVLRRPDAKMIAPRYAPEPPRESMRDAVGQARWIWAGADAAVAAPVGKRYFRRVVEVDDRALVESARVVMTADNSFTLYVNGTIAGSGDNFHQLYSFDVTELLHVGTNIVAVSAENGGASPNPAGLLGAFVVRYGDGREIVVGTDAAWLTAAEPSPDWARAAASGGWTAAADLGPFGMAPWGMMAETAAKRAIYPESEQITAVLESLGVPPDFEASAPLLYAHRETDAADIYFVSNGADVFVATDCIFRVADKQPELWHPETGVKRTLPVYTSTEDGRTRIPLQFEPAEAYFIVFHAPSESAAPAAPHAANFPTLEQVGEVAGPWTVSFDADMGGPAAPVRLERLENWTQRPEEEIRYYSGTATYTTTLNVSRDDIGHDLYLDLGRVEVMAAATLNGNELGVAWKSPFRFDISEAVRAGENELEVSVVNLWPNRMIGDDHLPPDSARRANGTLDTWPDWLVAGGPSPTGRHSFATWRHWTKTDELLPSGLLGPVRVLREVTPLAMNREITIAPRTLGK
jgi:hypothetical protein